MKWSYILCICKLILWSIKKLFRISKFLPEQLEIVPFYTGAHFYWMKNVCLYKKGLENVNILKKTLRNMSTLLSINQDGIFMAYVNFNLNPVPFFPLHKAFQRTRIVQYAEERKAERKMSRQVCPCPWGCCRLFHAFGQLSKLLIRFG